MLVKHVPTRWNSTSDMFEVTWEKNILDKVVSDYLNLIKINYSISSKEWDLLKTCLDELLSFHEIVEVLSKSKTTNVSTILRVYQLLIDPLNSSIDVLNNLSYDIRRLIMTIKQVTMLKSTYKMMKEKLLKYECHLKRSSFSP